MSAPRSSRPSSPHRGRAGTRPSRSQLSLLPEPGWQLDERTRQIGLRGVAEARDALRRARSGRPAPVDPSRSHAA